MYLLSSTDISSISGGTACLDTTIIQKIQNKAIKEGVMFSAFTVPLAMALTLGLFNQTGKAALTGVVLAPYAMMWGYLNSSVWNVLKN